MRHDGKSANVHQRPDTIGCNAVWPLLCRVASMLSGHAQGHARGAGNGQDGMGVGCFTILADDRLGPGFGGRLRSEVRQGISVSAAGFKMGWIILPARRAVQGLWSDQIIDGAIGPTLCEVTLHPWEGNLSCHKAPIKHCFTLLP